VADDLDVNALFNKPAASSRISNTTNALDVDKLFTPAPPQADKVAPGGITALVTGQSEQPQHDTYLGRAGDIWSDIKGVFHQGVEELKKVPGEMVGGPREPSVATKLLGLKGAALKPVGDLLSGFFDIVASPVKGPARSMVTRPIAEAVGTTPEQVERVTDLALPGLGVVSYGKGARLAGSAALKTVEKIFSPTTVDADATIAETLVRGTGGMAARDTAATRADMEPFHKTVNALPDTARLDFIDHVEGGAARTAALPQALQTLAGKMKDAFELRKSKLQALPSTQQAQFVEDYFPHFWQDPQQAQQFAQNFSGGASKQGSGASLHGRTVPTIADGIRAGLQPLTTDPIEATLRYVASMDRFIASIEVLDTAKAIGQVKWVKPKVMGASGHPDSFKVPAGWKPIEGRGATRANGSRAYAPEGFARVYNNFISRGFHELGGGEYGAAYDVAQRASNAVTALELGLSGFHAVTMANEAGISKLARGIHDIVGGIGALDARRMLRGAGAVASAPAAPVTSYLKGRGLEKVYLGQSAGSPDMARITDLLTKAGGRAKGAQHARDYSFSAMGSYWTAFKQGALKAQLQLAAADVKANPVLGTLRQGFAQMGRIMSTVAQPLFEVAIPRLKNGAFYDMMHAWLEANPTATYDRQVSAAREIWDSVDNRFGELVSDNVFWNQMLKQSAQLAMRSYSWNLGTMREIGGGAKDIASGRWTPRASYVIALPIWVGTMNAVYQKLKTGKNPESVQDLVGGQTGGEALGASVPPARGFGRSTQATVPERVSIPGYQKDVMGWYEDYEREAKNKIATLPRMLGEVLTNSNWRGDPIVNPEEAAPQWLKSYFNYAMETLGPISLRQASKGSKLGSNITRPEQLMGLRPAPSYVQDPEGYARQQKNIHLSKGRKKDRFEKKQRAQYGGTDE
jgi:hypothetical protein